MKYYKLILLITSIAFSLNVNGQIKAVTENGEEVILNENGTWKYSNVTPSFNTKLDTAFFKKPSNAYFQVKSQINKTAVWINPKVWSFKKKEDDDQEYEYFFHLKEGDAFVMMINEETEISLQSIQAIALNKMKSVAADAHLVSEEIRNINGHFVKCLETQGTIQGINVTYLGYYYSDKNGTTQLVGFSSSKLFKKYRQDIEDLLNGLDVNKN